MHMISVFFLCPIMKSDHIYSRVLVDASNEGRVKKVLNWLYETLI